MGKGGPRSSARLAWGLRRWATMRSSSPVETDAFLLALEDAAFANVGAILGLQSRPACARERQLVEALLDSDFAFSRTDRPLLVTALPGLRPQ